MLDIAADTAGILAGRRILVVEDEVILAELMVETLREFGAHVVGSAQTVKTALALIQTSPWIDAAVIDVNLAGELAYPVVDAMIALERPFVFSTAWRRSQLPLKYQSAPHCAKPMQTAVLLRELQLALREAPSFASVEARTPDGAVVDQVSGWVRSIAVNRDMDAFKEIFADLAPKVKQYLLSRGVSSAIAEELVQDVMLSVWCKAGQFDPARGSARAWIFTMARNLQIHGLRSRRRSGKLTAAACAPAPLPTPEEACIDRMGGEKLRKAIGQLPIDQADLLKLSFFGRQAHAGIALSSGLPLGAVKSRLRSALSTLRTTLNADTYDAARGRAD